MRHFLWILLLTTTSAYVSGQDFQSVNISYQSHQAAGVVTVEAVGFGNKNTAKIAAQKRAFEVLLFEGLPTAPNSKLRYPMVTNRSQAQQKHTDFFNTFFNKNGYRSYGRSISEPQKQKVKAMKKKKSFVLEMTISYEQLINDLRRQGIGKQMGFW